MFVPNGGAVSSPGENTPEGSHILPSYSSAITREMQGERERDVFVLKRGREKGVKETLEFGKLNGRYLFHVCM